MVFHYAAQINVRKSIEDPVKDAEINILGTINILENCKKYRIKKFIFASSVGVYGEPKSLPLKENNFLNPISPHAISKWAIEEHLKFYKNHGLDFVSLRYSNVYGPRQSYKNGGVTAIFISKILKGENPIVYNSGEQTRDFLYVDDAVEAAILTLKARSGSIYNVGTNQEIKIKDLLKHIAFKLQKKAKPTFKAIYRGEIIKSRIDFSEIKKEFGWKPKCNLDEGLNKTIKWFTRQNFLTNED